LPSALLLLVVVYVPMLIEARRAAANERTQRARGGIEAPGDVYDLMRVAYPAAFLAMIGEGVLTGRPPSRAALVAGALTWLLAKGLKWWAIVALGNSWTFRVITLSGAPLVGSGPYRFLRHPNYVAVVGELVGVMLMTRAFIAGPVGIAGFGLLILRRIAVEERALAHAERSG
jgi:methyltransferase